MEYTTMTKDQLKAEHEKVSQVFETLKAKNLKLDMSRGKPGKAQLDLVSNILTVLVKPEDRPEVRQGVLCRPPGLQAGGVLCRRQRQPDADV